MSRRYRSSLLVLVFVSLALALPIEAMAKSGPAGFADIAERLVPAVVNISTSQTITADDIPEFDLQFPPGSPFEEFFKEFMEKQGRLSDGKQRKRKATSLGSGFIIDATGYVVTNYHVVQDADQITVILQDNTNLPAKVIGRDRKTDLALLKVDSKKPLTAVSWGDSDKIRVGDWIIAIGNPFGLGGTVTAGIISARARDINSGPYDDYLQTDASINRGNSGGPMFDMNGEVIGVNTAIFSPSGGSIGIGFAIPANMARNVIEQLKTTGHVRRGWLGVRIQTVTQEIADSLGIGKARGALVSSVTPDSPASRANLEPGDVIVSFDGKDVTEMHTLPRLVAESPVDKTVPLTIIRKGKEMALNVKVAELALSEETPEAKDEKKETKRPEIDSVKIGALGVSVAPVTDYLRKRFDLDKDSKGLVVIAAPAESLAGENGVQTADVIAEANQKAMTTAKELIDVINRSKKDRKPLLLLVDRKGDMRFVAISFNKDEEDQSDN
jgi:serine protease Do